MNYSGKEMASSSDGKETDYKRQPPEMIDRQKSVTEIVREINDMLRRKEEDKPVGRQRRRVESETTEEEQKDKQEPHHLDAGRARDRDETVLRKMVEELKDLVVMQARSLADSQASKNGQSTDTVVLQKLEALRSQSAEQYTSLGDVKVAVKSIGDFVRIQEKDRRKLMRELGSLRDEMSALRQISEETRQRQQQEIQSSSTDVNRPQQQQQCTGKSFSILLLIDALVSFSALTSFVWSYNP